MKIVAMETVKMKIDSYIDSLTNEGVEIARIELSAKEFTNLWECVRGSQDVGNTHFEWSCEGGTKSGSYFVYRDICVQYHSSYKHGDLGVEYI